MRVGIIGYGNLGRGVEAAVNNAADMELVCIVTRRDPSTVKINSDVPVVSYSDLESLVGQVDVMVICGGSATDLPTMTPEVAKYFNVIDSFDTHARIPEHFGNVDEAAKSAGTVGIISVGWDPGLFSIARIYAESALPSGKSYTFWGRGVSQGHSDAIRRIAGVVDARQYTIPVPATLDEIRGGANGDYTAREMHTRDCYVVAEEGADLAAIEKEIKEMPNYFSDYDTTVTFISAEEMARDHSGLPHGGMVIRNGRTGMNAEYGNTIEFKLDLDSNPFFTGSVLTAAARAAYRLQQEGNSGCMTLFDVAPRYLSEKSADELRAHML